MGCYYSASTRGLYLTALHGDNIPADAVEITEAEHAALAGKEIRLDAEGRPVAVEPPQPDPVEVAVAAIEAKYETAFGRLRSALSVAMLADGPGMDAKVAALRAEWSATSNAQSAEIAALIGG